MERNDYILDNNFDMVIKNGDFYVAQSDQNHKAVILMSAAGQIRQFVKIGVDIQKELNGILDQKMKRRILTSFKQDDYNLRGISFENSQINIS